jgi:hypothetical protein
VLKIPAFAKRQNVTGHAKRRQCNNKTTEKMNKQANASTKSKELQAIAQADTVAAHLLLPNRTWQQQTVTFLKTILFAFLFISVSNHYNLFIFPFFLMIYSFDSNLII